MGDAKLGVALVRCVFAAWLVVSWSAADAHGLEKRYDINIPALKADAALKTLARQAETQLLFSYDYVKAIEANPVSGRYTLSEALEILLQDTGLSSSLTKGGVITVAPARTTAEQDAEQDMNGKKRLSLLGSIAAFFGMTIAPHAVWAAEPVVGLEEIIVTASRQGEQSIQDIPMSISAINTAALETLGQGGLDDLTRGIPSVSMQSSGPGRNKIDIRGITTGGFDFTDAQDRPLVSVYLDEVPISLAASNPELKVFDLERVEVIRGPQGTLYGAGSMAGTVRYVTTKPDLNRYAGDLQATLSQTEDSDGTNYNVRATANIPILQDRVGFRITGYHGKDSGFIDNVGTGRDDVNSYTTSQVRAALRANVSPDLVIDASFTYMDLEADGLPTGYIGLGDNRTSILWHEGYEDEMRIYNITADYDLGFADLIGSVSHVSRDNFNVIGGNQYLLAAFLWGEVVPAQIQVANDISETDVEFRLTSKQDQRLRWTVGAFYQDQSRSVWQFDPSDDFDNRLCALFGAPPGCYSSLDDGSFAPDADFSGLQNLDERQFAIFGEVSYDLTERLTATVGLRYFDWQQDFDLFFGGIFGVSAPGVPLTTVDSASTDGVNPRFVLSYDVSDDLMVFAEAARGFRYGGVNQPLPLELCAADLAAAGLTNGPATFGPDSLWSYSIGERSQFLQGALTLNATAYMIDWSDVQSKQFLPNCFYYFIQNEGEIRSQGLEMESNMRVTDRLTLGVNLSLTDSTANGDIQNLGAVDGDRVPYFPRYIAGLNGRYAIPIGGDELAIDGSWAFRGDSMTRFDQQDPDAREIPASDYLTLAITYRRGNWELGVFGQNLTNGTDILLRGPDSYAPFQPGDTVSWARPRTIGMRFKVSM